METDIAVNYNGPLFQSLLRSESDSIQQQRAVVPSVLFSGLRATPGNEVISTSSAIARRSKYNTKARGLLPVNSVHFHMKARSSDS
jgi:hypothetical protein